MAKFRSAAFSRANVPRETRSDFFLIVDEFHEFGAEAVFTSILSGTRKYGLVLGLAHQYAEQQQGIVRAALANCFTKIAFKLSDEALEKEFTGGDSDILTPGHVLIKEGEDSAFSGKPLPRQLPHIVDRLLYYARPAQIIELSRRKHSG